MVQVKLSYGHNGLVLAFPDTPGFQGVLRPQEATAVKNSEAAVSQALLNPIASPPLTELAAGRQSACIVISDNIC